MASRRSYKSARSTQNQDYSALNISDVLCPICRSIFLEPVTLPCNHTFCNCCFEGTVENANLVCPLCRIRIGSWIRKAKKQHKLINEVLWKTINDCFPQQVKNRLNGIDENLEQEPIVVVSYPGEIRKEYELQKQKENEEIKRKREEETKASEELILKLRQEEEYQKTILEEKLKIDEEIAKQLAAQFAINSPSTSGLNNVNKKFGPLDRFLKKDNETITSQQNNSIINRPNNFANKEYTCRVLCIDNRISEDDVRKSFSPLIKKRIQEIQKMAAETDTNSDSSDCIESEMRYFKPIDHRINPPSQGTSPIKIPSRKPLKNGTNRILSPSGLINFHSNMLESAFARITLSLPTKLQDEDIYKSPSHKKSSPLINKLKRSNEDNESPIPNKKFISKRVQNNKSPILLSAANLRRRLFDNSITSSNESSPLFYGFEKSNEHDINDAGIFQNNSDNIEENEEIERKLLQERADLEFAKRLQEEFNRTVHNTRSSEKRQSNFRLPKRQTTLDELMNNSYRVK